jgi:amidase
MRMSVRARWFLAALSVAGFWQAVPASADRFELATATIADIQKAMDRGALTSARLVELYLARIAAYDQKGPAIRAFLHVNSRALDDARALDAERKAKGPRSPIHGIAVVLKDVFDTHDMPTTGGYLPLKGVKPTKDAFVVKKLRDAGAVILGKVNQSDWYAETEILTASTLGGATRNPYDLARTPGWSSSGTGAAMAAYFATIGLGSETGFSVRTPTSDSNLYGLSTTSGLISRDGQMWSYMTGERGGPMARSVYDVAVTLDVIAGFDPADLWTGQSLGRMPAAPYASFIDATGLKEARVGVLKDAYALEPVTPEGLELAAKSVKVFEANGAHVIHDLSIGIDLAQYNATNFPHRFERLSAINHYLSRQGPGYPFRNAAELLLNHPNVKTRATDAQALKAPFDLDRNPEYRLLNEDRIAMRRAITNLMDAHKLDAVIFPHKLHGPLRLGPPADPERMYQPNLISPLTGFPAFIVPSGFTADGLPIGFEILGRPWSEPTLIRIAAGFEAATRNRRIPPHTPPLRGESFDY